MNRVLLGGLVVWSSVAWAIPPEPSYAADLDAAAAELREKCDSKVKVGVDLESFDSESIRDRFSPTAVCLVVVRALIQVCEHGHEPKFMNEGLDPTPVFDLTEVRCTLDKKHELAVREWRKGRRDPNAPGEPPKKIFSDLRSTTNPAVPAEYPIAVPTWSGTTLVVGLMANDANTDDAIYNSVRSEGKARADKPGYNAHQKQVLDRITAKRQGAEASRWKRLAADNAGAVRRADELLKAAADKATDTCKVPITASIDWASVEAPTEDSCTQPPCTPEEKVVGFAEMCRGVLEGVEEACKDDALWPQVKAKVKAVACRYDRQPVAKGAPSGAFSRELKGTTVQIRMGWDAANVWSDTSKWLKQKL